MRIYLDNNATTAIHPAVLDELFAAEQTLFGNASSIHEEGQRARRAIESAREQVASLIGAGAREIVFTSGGTESNNAALAGLVLGGRGSCHFVTTVIEHPSVLEPLRALEAMGHELTRIGCDRSGVVDPAAVIAAMRPATRGVAVMFANNESGAIQPVAEIGQVCRERGIHFHCDAVQAGGRVPIDVTALGADTLSLSAHKMHGPKGIGALFVRSGTELAPLLRGGAQERRRRAGTESVPLAVAFGAAARIARSEPESERISALRERLERAVLERLPAASVNASGARRLPNTSSFLFRGCDGEALVIAFDLEGIAISTGSACSSGRVEPSRVLIEMGLSEEDARSSVRISLSRFTTADEIDRVVASLEKLVSRNTRVVAAGTRGA
jgi:cysteine desulfurase